MSPEQESLPQVLVSFGLEIGSGSMNISTPVPQQRVDLVQLLPSLKQLSSNIIGAVVETVHQEGYEISCKAGCGACCRQLVPLTLFEAEELGNWIETLPLEQQALLERRFTEGLVKLKNSGVLDQLDFTTMPSPRSQEALEIGLRYFAVGVPCPFLENESCSIHPIRPLVCREYMVTSPAEFCSKPSLKRVMPVPVPVRLSGALSALGSAITAEKRGWMPLIFLFAFLRLGVKVAKAYEGTGPELLKLVMETITSSEEPKDAVAPATG